MPNMFENTQTAKDDIKSTQKLFSSWATILHHCLKTNGFKSTACDQYFREFDDAKEQLESAEFAQLKPLNKTLANTKAQFNQTFDHLGKANFTPVESLPEEAAKLKETYSKGTEELLKSRREFESFRNEILKNTVIQHAESKDNAFVLNWEKPFPNNQINTLLEVALHDSTKEIKAIDKRLTENQAAPFISVAEMLNAELVATNKLRK